MAPIQEKTASVAMRSCYVCGKMRQTTHASYEYNVGLLVKRETHYLSGNMCRACVHKKFWECSGKDLVLGWWGAISMAVTPIYFAMNVYSYLKALYQLRGSSE